MAALEIVMLVAAVLALVTAFAYLWKRLGLIGSSSTRRLPPPDADRGRYRDR